MSHTIRIQTSLLRRFQYLLLFLLGSVIPGWAQTTTEIVSPVPGSVLTSSTVTFTFDAPRTSGGWLDIGTTGQGSTDIRNDQSGFPAGTASVMVTGVPTDKRIYVTLWVTGNSANNKHYTFGSNDPDDDGINSAIDPNPTVANPKTTLPAGSDFMMTILGSGRVASLQSATLFASTTGNPSTTDVQAVASRIYQKFNDDFDFIFVAANRATPGASATAAGIHYAVSNAVGGIGLSTFNGGAGYGSTSGKLQSYLYLATLDGLTRGPSLHELMHRWGNNLSPVIPGAAGDSGHWGYSSVGGQLGGYKAGTRELVSGSTYRAKSPRTGNFGGWGTFANGGNGLPYSQLELYLMGMIDKTLVTDALEVANGVTNFNSSTGQFDASSITTVTMTQITEAKGERNPLVTTSQKVFRTMMVVLTDTPLTNAQWAAADDTVESFSRTSSDGTSGYNFWEATGGIGTLSMGDLNSSIRSAASDNADLSALTSSAGAFTPSFAAATTAYTASVPNATTSVTVTPTVAQANATVKVNTVTVSSGSPSAAIALNVGINTISTVVTAQDGTTTKTYTFTVTRAAASGGGGEIVGTNLGSIPDNNPTGRDIPFDVTGRTGIVTAVTVQFTLSPVHTFIGDLGIQLIAPDNTVASMMSWTTTMPGRGVDCGGPYLISDTGTQSIAQGAAPLGTTTAVVPGTYRAADLGTLVSMNTIFNGKAPNGTWKLRFVDGFDGDSGTVSDARLNLSTVVTPTVTTAIQTSVAATTAVLGGNVSADGGASVTDRGIVWATTATPTIATNKVANGTGTGAFSGAVSSLPTATLIYVRAYATNSAGTGYGSQISFTTLSPVTLPSGAVSWYQAENNPQDSVGTNHASAFGTSYSAGKKGQSFSLTGADGSYLNCTNNSNLQLATGTVEVWIKTSPSGAGSSFRGIIVKQHAYGLFLEGNNLIGYDWVNTTLPSIVNLGNNAWHHVALTFTAGSMKLYADGVVVNSRANFAVSNQNSALVLGAGDPTGASQNFNGLIDEATIYNRVLSEAEILSIFNAGGAGKVVGSPPVPPNDFAVTRNGANLGFNFTSTIGRTYTLWQSDTLVPGSWTNTGQPAIPGDGAAKSFSIPAPNSTVPKRFYRVQVE